jgi:hypothetical protein
MSIIRASEGGQLVRAYRPTRVTSVRRRATFVVNSAQAPHQPMKVFAKFPLEEMTDHRTGFDDVLSDLYGRGGLKIGSTVACRRITLDPVAVQAQLNCSAARAREILMAAAIRTSRPADQFDPALSSAEHCPAPSNRSVARLHVRQFVLAVCTNQHRLGTHVTKQIVLRGVDLETNLAAMMTGLENVGVQTARVSGEDVRPILLIGRQQNSMYARPSAHFDPQNHGAVVEE